MLRDVGFRYPAIGRRDLGDACKRQLFGRAVLEGAEVTLRAAAGLWRVERDVFSAKLLQGQANLGLNLLRDPLAGHGGVEIMAAPVGIEGAE